MLDRTVRADFSGGSEPTLLNCETVDGGDDLVMSVETTLLTSGRVGKKVYIISTEVWTQTLQFPIRAVSGLSEAELRESLAHEAEAVSGIEAAQSALAYAALTVESGEQRYWVSQISAFLLERLEESVKHSGGRLAGVLHPAGLTAQVSGRCFVELWPGVISAHGEQDIQVLSMDPKLNDWQVVLESWLAKHSADSIKHFAAGSDLVPANSTEHDWWTLDQQEQLLSWLNVAVRTLSASSKVPQIRAAKKRVSAQQLNTITAAACGVTIAICALHFIWISLAQQSMTARLSDARQVSTQITNAKRDLAKLEQDKQKLQSEVLTQTQSHDQMLLTQQAHRQRWAKLLRLLAKHSPENLVVQNIDQDQDNVKISGVCLEPQLANELAAGLTEHLIALGWQVHPPEKKALARMRNGGPWSYEIVLENVAVDPSVIEPPLAAQEGQP